MTDRAAELREALEGIGPVIIMPRRLQGHQQTIIDAALTIALPILEGDEGLVERIASTIADAKDWHGLAEIVKEAFRADARRVLAALIPEEGEGE